MSVVDTAKERVQRLRERRPVVDHLVRMVEHYGSVNGNALAAAVTYFAFLSFFPILALAFAIFGQVSKVYPGARDALLKAADSVLPNLIGPPSGIGLDTLEAAAPGIFSVGIVLTLYSGLGWLSGMRKALMTIFDEPEGEQPNFVMGKARDILALLTLGSVLVLSVAVSGVLTKVLDPILKALQLGAVAGAFFWILALALGLAANSLLFFAFFRLLAEPNVPRRSLWSGALLGAIVFELLKQASTFLLKSTSESEAFQAFGIALILLVWINYFSRVVVLSAAWAYTAPEARAQREAAAAGEGLPEGPRIDVAAVASGVRPDGGADGSGRSKAAFAAGAASMLGLVALVRRRR